VSFSAKVPRKKFVNTASKEREKIISNIHKDFTVGVEDESIFIHDAVIRRKMWTLKVCVR
jgi:hypothetical protein